MCSSINPIHHSIDPMKSSSFMHPLIPIHFTHPSLPLFLPYSSIHLFIHLTRHRSPSHLPYLSSILPFFHPFIHSIIPTIHLLGFFHWPTFPLPVSGREGPWPTSGTHAKPPLVLIRKAKESRATENDNDQRESTKSKRRRSEGIATITNESPRVGGWAIAF